ncbi:FAD-dependent monooxygenase [Allonocardiopsis opalescens]|uniref:4,5-epoxidase n=1 Tax=Allonocardiopsis opalescens TaxID=1144618 RepID=A0A2T0QFJ3_9ACTN|nr:FAD-dependent monooxygenase [Allonocardiopsis opalescens]PRY02682.1 4,5-epoxidase [Allonocardiopsis opalescens]
MATVLVVGAGPTGLALACELLGRGVDTVVADRAPGPAAGSRALGLTARGMEILHWLGAAGELPRRAVAAMGAGVYAGPRRLAHVRARPQEPPSVFLIGQAEVEAALRDRVAELGGTIRWEHELVDLAAGDGRVTAILKGPQGEARHPADWLVGCDGAHSTTRSLAGIAFEGDALPQTFLIADARIDWDRPADETAVWLHPDGVLAALPMPGDGQWRITASLPEGARVDTDRPEELLRRLLAERRGEPAPRLEAGGPVSAFRVQRRLAARYRSGRVLLAGDAAHVHSPSGGQGMNLGLGDAHNLGWKLALVANGRAAPELLDSYAAERRPVAAATVRDTTALTEAALSDRAAHRLLREWVVLPLSRTAPVRRQLMRAVSQLDTGYRRGPLAPATAPGGRALELLTGAPRPGDRGPDAEVRLPDGSTGTLLARMRGGWSLLLFGPPTPVQRELATGLRERLGPDLRVLKVANSTKTANTASWVDELLVDHCRAVRRGYRPARRDAVLLRPDGHIGWRALRGTDPVSWLSALLDRGAVR